MQLKFVYLSLVSLASTHAVAGNGLIGSAPSLQQQILPEVFSTAMDSEKFWQRARSYGDKLLDGTAEHASDVRQKIAEVKDAVSAFVRAATALQDELQTSDALVEDLYHALEKMLKELQVMFPAPSDPTGVLLAGCNQRFGVGGREASAWRD
ncbi:hypothetical protein B0H19DRAFT_1169207 [Mycena capillaripes]|nr:hypothetical protein B0H19DRAFT_1169207 [Mycena capillaripes]